MLRKGEPMLSSNEVLFLGPIFCRNVSSLLFLCEAYILWYFPFFLSFFVQCTILYCLCKQGKAHFWTLMEILFLSLIFFSVEVENVRSRFPPFLPVFFWRERQRNRKSVCGSWIKPKSVLCHSAKTHSTWKRTKVPKIVEMKVQQWEKVSNDRCRSGSDKY